MNTSISFMMRPFTIAIFIILLTSNALAIITVQAGIFNSGSTLTIKAKASGGDISGTDVPFGSTVTFRYLTSYGVTISSPTGSLGFSLQSGSPFTIGNYTYRIYSTVTTTSQSFNNGVEVSLFSVTVSGGSGTGTFELVNPGGSYNGDWYFEYNGYDYTNYSTPFYQASVGNVPLPVELISFTGKVLLTSAYLHWETATEINNYGFNVERSNNIDKNWQTIGFVPGHGTSNYPQIYDYIDNLQSNPINFKEKIFYRLKQIDRDGTIDYSFIVGVSFSRVSSLSLDQNFPNPFRLNTTITYSIPLDQHVSINVYDLVGRLVKSVFSGFNRAGMYALSFHAEDLPAGIYHCVLSNGTQTKSKEFILLN